MKGDLWEGGGEEPGPTPRLDLLWGGCRSAPPHRPEGRPWEQRGGSRTPAREPICPEGRALDRCRSIEVVAKGER